MAQREHHKFWMIWNPEGYQPRVMHYSRPSADAEAERLAQENPGQQFFVLKAVSGVCTDMPTVLPIKLRQATADEIPF